MGRAAQSPEVLSQGGPGKEESGRLSIESVLQLQKLIFAGSPQQRLYLEEEIRAQCGAIVGESAALKTAFPILEAWRRADARFAQTSWPWILLSQKPSLPESYLLGAPKAVFDNPVGQGSFSGQIREEYVSTYRDPDRVHGICEEYRAAATIDVEHDRRDKEASRRIDCPMLHLWAEGGPLDTFYSKDGGPLGVWRQWAPQAQGQAMKGGHFFPEENPDGTALFVKQFLSGQTGDLPVPARGVSVRARGL
jgi:pimeloyl-ACP methyl ester carboxylesterase